MIERFSQKNGKTLKVKFFLLKIFQFYQPQKFEMANKVFSTACEKKFKF